MFILDFDGILIKVKVSIWNIYKKVMFTHTIFTQYDVRWIGDTYASGFLLGIEFLLYTIYKLMKLFSFFKFSIGHMNQTSNSFKEMIQYPNTDIPRTMIYVDPTDTIEKLWNDMQRGN